MNGKIDSHIRRIFTHKIEEIGGTLSGDILLYFGPIDDRLVYYVNELVRGLKENSSKDENRDKLFIILTTNGGSATACERYVSVFRQFYKEVNFIIPDYAYSAGTILTMSGDNIYMDYLSVLGPIDPQVMNKDGHYVPALGYLDKINELLKKAEEHTLSDAEFLILRDFDLADIRSYEQAKALTIDLLERWLVKYKFKDWTVRETSGEPVTDELKSSRAKEIGEQLSDNNLWKSHGRPIHKDRLIEELNLKINDMSELPCYDDIKELYSLLRDHIEKDGRGTWIQTRNGLIQ